MKCFAKPAETIFIPSFRLVGKASVKKRGMLTIFIHRHIERMKRCGVKETGQTCSLMEL